MGRGKLFLLTFSFLLPRVNMLQLRHQIKRRHKTICRFSSQQESLHTWLLWNDHMLLLTCLTLDICSFSLLMRNMCACLKLYLVRSLFFKSHTNLNGLPSHGLYFYLLSSDYYTLSSRILLVNIVHGCPHFDLKVGGAYQIFINYGIFYRDIVATFLLR